jgi:hypothetical protein
MSLNKESEARLEKAMKDCSFWMAEYSKNNKETVKKIEGIKEKLSSDMDLMQDRQSAFVTTKDLKFNF